MKANEIKDGGTKPNGWFSRRHRTATAHEEAKARYLTEHGRRARQRKAKERRDAE